MYKKQLNPCASQSLTSGTSIFSNFLGVKDWEYGLKKKKENMKLNNISWINFWLLLLTFQENLIYTATKINSTSSCYDYLQQDYHQNQTKEL